ncbi:hypothetical protein AB0467_33900, partial [Streptomyces sp. NPDC052095]|uniref:hypothetical protein n=1 Tax=Streptomyces sp. NPDC052095 TaxID=3155678 RepID=UPI00344C96E6
MSTYWTYVDVPTTRRGAVAVVARPPGIAGQPLEVLTKALDVTMGDEAGGEAEEGFVDVVA